ncbi:AI-2E family transporter [Clostridium hydrogenum]|uniref:AI-2E family transporter n=1 Tax=Clostridium hydrogenum TaxID=2855764 RepID=UPI001F1EE6B9|nr:AI-2E family transporter [Clostridium hydrogenum]
MKINKYFFTLINIMLILIIIILLGQVSYVLSPLKQISSVLLFPTIISLFLYYALRPIINKFKDIKIIKTNKSVLIIITMLLFSVILAAALVYGGLKVKDEFTSSFSYDINSISSYFDDLDKKLGGVLSQFEITQKILTGVKKSILNTGTSLINVFSQVTNVGTKIIIIPFILYYFLKDDKKFAHKFLSIIPDAYRNEVKEMLIEIDNALSVYISGQLIIALITGVMMYFAYLIVGLPNSFLMAFFFMVTVLIPYIGSFIGIIPALLIALITGGGTMVINTIIVAIIVNQIQGNLVSPNIIGKKLNIHPLAIVFITLISITLFGVLGAFVGTPLFVTLSIVIKGIYKLYSEKKIEIGK